LVSTRLKQSLVAFIHRWDSIAPLFTLAHDRVRALHVAAGNWKRIADSPQTQAAKEFGHIRVDHR
jgi:hypothetical protein